MSGGPLIRAGSADWVLDRRCGEFDHRGPEFVDEDLLGLAEVFAHRPTGAIGTAVRDRGDESPVSGDGAPPRLRVIRAEFEIDGPGFLCRPDRFERAGHHRHRRVAAEFGQSAVEVVGGFGERCGGRAALALVDETSQLVDDRSSIG